MNEEVIQQMGNIVAQFSIDNSTLAANNKFLSLKVEELEKVITIFENYTGLKYDFETKSLKKEEVSNEKLESNG